MSENKNAKTPADGPEYERGFVDGMQRQMQLNADRLINKQPTKIFGPGLEEILNSAGFYRKQWVGLTAEEIAQGPQEVLAVLLGRNRSVWPFRFEAVVAWAEAKLKEKNHG